MNVEQERLSARSFIPYWVIQEHTARFRFSAQFVSQKTIIDCACGSGTGTSHFVSRNPRQVYAFDVSPEALDEAKKNNPDPRINFQQSDAVSLPLPKQVADVFISLETIEHLQTPGEFLKEVARVLKDDGIFICSTPNRSVTNPGKSFDDPPCNKYHLQEYTTSEFQKALSDQFRTIEMYGQNPLNKKLVSFFSFWGRMVRFPLGSRMHQITKLILSPLRSGSYYQLRPLQPEVEYEYITALCRK